MATGWPKVTTAKEDNAMPHASPSALYARLVDLVKTGRNIDQLRGRALAYVLAAQPEQDGKATVGTKAPQNFFGPKGPWPDYEDEPASPPMSAPMVAHALGEPVASLQTA